MLPSPSTPMEVARELVRARYTGPDGALTLRHWRGGWWDWHRTRWVEIEQRAARAAAYEFTEHASYVKVTKDGPRSCRGRRTGTRSLICSRRSPRSSTCPESVSMPTWLDGTAYDGLIVSVANGLLDVGRRELLAHDPRFFNSTSVPFDFDPDALDPERWEAFLKESVGRRQGARSTRSASGSAT